MRAARGFSLIFLIVVGGCGPAGGSGSYPFYDTLNFIRDNGLPNLSTLMPALPNQFAAVKGVETSNGGLPAVPDNLGGVDLGGGANDFNAFVSEAETLSAQGFSEARRVEALVHNFAQPLFDLVGRGDVFEFSDDDGSSTEGAALQGDVVSNIFDLLRSELKYAVALGGSEGMPDYLMMEAGVDSASVAFTGFYTTDADAGEGSGLYNAAFRADIRIVSLTDFDVTLTFAPGLSRGLIPSWGTQNCANDLMSVSLSALEGVRTASVSTVECPDTRNSVSSLALDIGAAGFGIRGGFAQSYPDAQSGTLRGWLGTRQGFILQAATDSELTQVAAAAAVLGETDFANPSQDTVDQFGVGRLLSRYVQSEYWQPTLDNSGSTFSPRTDNLAYWTCKAPIVSSSLQSSVDVIDDLCDSREVDPEPMLSGMQDLNDEVQSISAIDSGIRNTVQGIVDILTIRNTIYIGGDATLAYKDAPNDAALALDEQRSQTGVATLDDLAWQSEAQFLLPQVSQAEIPDTPYKAAAGALGGFLSAACENLAADAAAKSGGSASGVCGG